MQTFKFLANIPKQNYLFKLAVLTFLDSHWLRLLGGISRPDRIASLFDCFGLSVDLQYIFIYYFIKLSLIRWVGITNQCALPAAPCSTVHLDQIICLLLTKWEVAHQSILRTYLLNTEHKLLAVNFKNFWAYPTKALMKHRRGQLLCKDVI